MGTPSPALPEPSARSVITAFCILKGKEGKKDGGKVEKEEGRKRRGEGINRFECFKVGTGVSTSYSNVAQCWACCCQICRPNE